MSNSIRYYCMVAFCMNSLLEEVSEAVNVVLTAFDFTNGTFVQCININVVNELSVSNMFGRPTLRSLIQSLSKFRPFQPHESRKLSSIDVIILTTRAY